MVIPIRCNICLGLLLNLIYLLIKNFSFHFIFLVTICFLLLLGYWQTQRLEWKTNIINSVEKNYMLKLEKFPFEGGIDKEFEFMQVELKGFFIKEKLMYFFKSNLNGMSGFEIVLPLKTEDAKYVYVILGWIPYDFKEKFNLEFIDANKEFIVNGALIYSKERKPLIPDNEYSASIWYLLNTDEMDNFHKIESSAYILKITDQNKFENLLIEFEPSNIRNNHLQYAVTWFLLSIVILIMYIYYIRQGNTENEV